ncbi:hypothetical protein [Duganella qianjiadongensis]|uniref:Cysteine-rich CWC family protein n=1 Tax=Duganella qianjiadongensis TaxID=2692176 RepID=A0ABW9VP53_9BURK|nr:hypothetical protein [Duganella qianjiadongensis]MYM41346.1 hypothetical protein [Duganella qianjiadongensis]
MSQCTRCGAQFHCAMADGAAPAIDAASAQSGSSAVAEAPCWCTELPMLLPVPVAGASGCWCPDCLRAEIAAQQRAHAGGSAATELKR